MSAVLIKADTRELDALIPDLKRGVKSAHKKVVDRGAELLAEEAPGRVAKGVQKPEITGDGAHCEGKIVVSAPVEKPARSGVVHYPSGKTKEVSLKATSYDIAEAVATGTGVHGPRGTVIRPKKSKFLLIDVGVAGAGESYIEDGGQRYIVRPSSEGMEPDHYDERAADRLEAEAEEIAGDALVESGVAE